MNPPDLDRNSARKPITEAVRNAKAQMMRLPGLTAWAAFEEALRFVPAPF
jgi:hypothetical protein